MVKFTATFSIIYLAIQHYLVCNSNINNSKCLSACANSFLCQYYCTWKVYVRTWEMTLYQIISWKSIFSVCIAFHSVNELLNTIFNSEYHLILFSSKARLPLHKSSSLTANVVDPGFQGLVGHKANFWPDFPRIPWKQECLSALCRAW